MQRAGADLALTDPRPPHHEARGDSAQRSPFRAYRRSSGDSSCLLEEACSPWLRSPCPVSLCPAALTSPFVFTYFPNLSARPGSLKPAIKAPDLISLCDQSRASDPKQLSG